MAKRHRARAVRRKVASTEQERRNQLDAPPVGPGKTITVEEFPEGSIGNARRYRNHGEHPLSLAYYRHKLDGAGKDAIDVGLRRFTAGESFRAAFEATIGSGRSALEPVVRSGKPSELSDIQLHAGMTLRRIKAALGETATYTILEAFCGHGHAMIDALRVAGVPFAPQGVIPRIVEALDDLVRVLSRPLPPAPRTTTD